MGVVLGRGGWGSITSRGVHFGFSGGSSGVFGPSFGGDFFLHCSRHQCLLCLADKLVEPATVFA